MTGAASIEAANRKVSVVLPCAGVPVAVQVVVAHEAWARADGAPARSCLCRRG